MKNYINKSAKRILSLALALVMLAGCLFTANVGVNIKASAETTDSYADWDNVQCWNGTPLTSFWNADTEGEYAGKYVIRTAAQLQFACAAKRDNTIGKSFVIDPTIDAFIMQPQEAVDELGIAAFVELSGGEETREFFEKTYTAAGYTPVNWLTLSGNNALFNGNFDGSGVPIYGIYADAVALNVDNAGFFPGTRKNESGCMTIENLVIKNCYFKGYRRASILSGCAWAADGNYATVDSCIFANCYLLGQNLKSDMTTATYKTNEMGLLGGGMSNEPVQLSNTLVYGNKTEYDTYTDSDSDGTYETVTTTTNAFNWLFKENKGSGTNKGSVKNCVILDAQVNYLTEDSTTYCQNVYSNVGTPYTNVTNMIDNESVKGAHGRYYMSALGWDSAWWAIENDYPTPIKPSDSYVSVAAKEFEGSGTKDDPYLIYCAKQLDTMVADGGKTSGSPSYYKVADGVDAIYINKAENLEDVKTLYSAGSYNNWIHGSTAFHGNFDGNGVTIYGMICKPAGSSEYVGFVPKLSTVEAAATIKNVNFAGVYMTSYNFAAVVSSQVSTWSETTDTYQNNPSLTSYITNVTVRESYIKAASNGNVSTVTDDNGVTWNVHGATAAGILSTGGVTPDHVTIANCLYDGGSCEMYDGNSTTDRSYAAAGIVSVQSGGNEITVNNCVSIGINAIPMVAEVDYDYSDRYINCAHEFITVYGNIPDGFNTSEYAECATCYDIGDKTSFSMLDMPLLNWGGAWDLVEYDGRMIPMPKTSDKVVDAYTTQLAKQNNGKGAVLPDKTRPGGYKDGTYGMYEEFLGSGTKDDPYIISDALDLARAIACGGKDITTRLYYKLACDIDVGSSWITDAVTVAGKYQYVPFEGHIDGDGHTIYNLYAMGETASLIPQIKGGASIKNLHIRNSNIVVGDDVEGKGAFFGKYMGAGKGSKVTLEGCSFEGNGVEGGVKYLTGDLSNTKIKNSYAIYNGNNYYYIDYHYSSDSADDRSVPTADYTGNNADTAVWYKGGKDDCKPQLVNRAKAMSEVDISGYGDNDYDANDIASLRQRLLGNPSYANVYGDVNRDGKTNLGDLAILTRQLVGTYNMYADGFWRNAALGNIVIYYGENDNYDFARKLELALENEFGKDVKKVVVGNVGISGITYGNKSENGKLYVHKNDIYTDGTNYYKFNEDADGAINPVVLDPENDAAEIAKYKFDGNCQIVVGDISVADSTGKQYKTDLTGKENYNNYKITHEKANSAIWLQGGSFTAVEQATLDFINESNPDSNTLYDADGAVKSLTTVAEEKVAITVDGEPYYYAWGDEFSGTELQKDTWNYCTMHNETDNPDDKFENLEVAFPEDFEKLYEVTTDGKLKIWRGYYGDHNTSYDWGYKNLGSQKTGDNGFGDTVDSDDKYVSAGKIITNKSMLVKQGYLEMKATYPSDNHAFTCWWLLGHHNVANSTMSDSLFGKVFKLNNKAAYTNSANADLYAWDGVTNNLNSSDPRTFKHIRPLSSFEIDIAELMQASNADVNANFTIHKFYRDGVYTNANGKNAIKFIDWDYVTTGTRNAKNMVDGPHYTLTFNQGFKENYSWWEYDSTTTAYMSSRNISEFLYDSEVTRTGNTTSGYTYNNYNGEMIGTHQGAKDSTDNPHFSKTEDSVNLDGGQEYIFGVKWDASNANAIFTFTVTKVGETTPIKTVTLTEDIVYHEDKSGTIDTFLSKITSLETDKQTANQYMYMLIDNVFYSSNANGSIWDNLMSQESGDTTVMEIDYVRVYQEKRDIVTPDTEAFNNGNHFGY